jgi:hypothetical protein
LENSNFNQINFFAKNSILTLEIKNINKELKYYINKLRHYLLNSANNNLNNNELDGEIKNISSLLFNQKTEKKFTKVNQIHES